MLTRGRLAGYKNVLDAVEEYFRTLVQRKKEDKLFELERFMAQVYEENGRCEAAEVAALCLANLYNSGGHRKITPDEYETIKKYLQKFPESMHIRAAFIIASEAIYSPSAEYKRVPDKIINKAKQWSEQYQPIIQPLITPTLRSASGQGGSPGSRTLRRSSTTR